MKWPGQRVLEERIEDLEKRNYTDAITRALLTASTGESVVKAGATGALEACAGFVGRAFASAQVQGSDMARSALSPAILGHLGRALLQYGEMLFMLRTDGGRLRLAPAQSWDVVGDPDPQTWRYRVTLGGASVIETFQDVPRDGVVHAQYSFDNREPWRGVGPLTHARLAGRLSAETVAALADEASSPRGSFLSVPVDGEDPTVARMKADIPKARGKMLLAQGGDWDAGMTGGRAMWKSERFGADPPVGLVDLLKASTNEIYAACGLNPALFTSEGESGAREAYRQALHSVVAPLGRIASDELTVKLDTPVSLDWQELRAGDISGRSRAFQSLVGGGMDVAKAAALSGLMSSED